MLHRALRHSHLVPWVLFASLLVACSGELPGTSEDEPRPTADLDGNDGGANTDAATTDAATSMNDAGPKNDAAPSPDGSTASFAPAFPGEPAPGQLLWGAAVSGNGDPVTRHETPAGHPLTVHRTFYQWSQRTTSMVSAISDDLTHGRLPWVSVKPPSWAAMADGTYDSEIDSMLNALAKAKGPLWLTIHHEPEGGGGVNSPDDPAGPSGHLAMNKRVRARMTALAIKNVALAPILMSYTWQAGSGRDPNAWWAAGVYDFLGVDHYRDGEATLLTPAWADIRTWAKAKGVEIAVGEWGVRGTDAAAGARVSEWYDMAAGSNADGKGARVVALSAFDSSLNSPSGSWELVGSQLSTFQTLLGDPRTARTVP